MENELPEKDEPTPIPVEDSQLDPQGIMAEIRAQIIHTGQSSSQGPDTYPAFKQATYPQKPDDIAYDIELYQLLDALKREHRMTGAELDLRESSVSHIPIVGRFWKSVQRLIHGPAHYYANRTADRQAEINSQIFQILGKLMVLNQEQQREIDRLRAELEQLREENR